MTQTVPSLNALGMLLRERDHEPYSIQVGRESYTAPLCFAEALRFAPCAVFIWLNLGDALLDLDAKEHVTVNGRIYTAQLCFVEAVTIDDGCAAGWLKLGTTVGASKSNWAGLVRWVTGTPAVPVKGNEYSALECYLRAVHCDPSLSLHGTT